MEVRETLHSPAESEQSFAEARYREIFNALPVALWDADLTDVVSALRQLRIEQTKDIQQYLKDNPSLVQHLFRLIRVRDVNAYSLELFEVDDKDLLMRSFGEICAAQSVPFLTDLLLAIQNGDRHVSRETAFRTMKGREIDVALTVNFLSMDFRRGLITIRDISGRKKGEELQRLLLREMNHRVKNLFALTMSLVGLSAKAAETPKQLAATILKRLKALDRAHNLTLADRDSTDVEATLTFHSLARTIVEPYQASHASGIPRVTITGDNVEIAQSSITPLALILHELTTNAAKYGALSVPHGVVSIACQSIGCEFSIIWTETGGPPIEALPSHEGFGCQLVKASLGGSLRGSLSLDWRKEGLVAQISFPRPQ